MMGVLIDYEYTEEQKETFRAFYDSKKPRFHIPVRSSHFMIPSQNSYSILRNSRDQEGYGSKPSTNQRADAYENKDGSDLMGPSMESVDDAQCETEKIL